ncbi:hypothetical protein RHMOL_Rhmol10G0147400 [Rhododendron molle]|uniref:Uncharacterized protein n=1 Tax=Rhododendron molle TaxID=49168 RepID=A0ACC0M2K6_RHOML|nr:hypothetical protein RHMOL_Rhmol10G0147400 [Rhododendron molle]
MVFVSIQNQTLSFSPVSLSLSLPPSLHTPQTRRSCTHHLLSPSSLPAAASPPLPSGERSSFSQSLTLYVFLVSTLSLSPLQSSSSMRGPSITTRVCTPPAHALAKHKPLREAPPYLTNCR